ncbi:MAG: hypothetical protein JXQ87_09425 [Bacteroidia bacterium]
MDNNKHLEDLAHIRSMMEGSTRFISLSGLSGVGAGISALIGAAVIYYTSGSLVADYSRVNSRWLNMDYMYFEVLVALIVLAMALSSGLFFTMRKAQKKGQKLFTKASIRMLINLAIPLIAGGTFCLLLMYHGYWALVGPCTLIFYGLALLNCSKYTLNELRTLGIAEIILGLLCTFLLHYTLIFWAIGFGLLHIVYGLLMYFKYEK